MRVLMFWDISWYIMAAKNSTVLTLNQMTYSSARKWMNLEPMYQIGGNRLCSNLHRSHCRLYLYSQWFPNTRPPMS